MRRFAKIDPAALHEIKARDLDPIDLKMQWIEMSVAADAAIERIANEHPDLPIGCAFVDAEGHPKWVENEPDLGQHFASFRGCVPQFHIEEN